LANRNRFSILVTGATTTDSETDQQQFANKGGN